MTAWHNMPHRPIIAYITFRIVMILMIWNHLWNDFDLKSFFWYLWIWSLILILKSSYHWWFGFWFEIILKMILPNTESTILSSYVRAIFLPKVIKYTNACLIYSRKRQRWFLLRCSVYFFCKITPIYRDSSTLRHAVSELR